MVTDPPKEYTKQEMWQWLKAENHYKPPKEKTRPALDRATRRRILRTLRAR